jgi:hypothetical protein
MKEVKVRVKVKGGMRDGAENAEIVKAEKLKSDAEF